MNILFINYFDFSSNSAAHIFYLANHLTDLGARCAVCVPNHKETVRSLGRPNFLCVEFDEARDTGLNFKNGRGPSLIHAWTPRELVRELTQKLAARYSCPYVVHMEDNEEIITVANIGMTTSEMTELPPEELDRLVGPSLTHPTRSKEFIAHAAGMTALIDRLLEFKPDGVPGEIFWPGYDEAFHTCSSIDYKWRSELGIADSHHVIVYIGNVHPNNWREVLSLYLAVGLLNRRGMPVKLIRAGTNHCQLFGKSLDMLKEHTIELGWLPHRDMPRLVGLADILVQPGGPSEFNDLRFPSKLPEYLATGKPVVLPRTNIGRYMKDGEECVLLDKGNAIEIAQKVEMLLMDAALRRRIGEGGRAFAESNLSWANAARQLYRFYAKVLEQPTVGGTAADGVVPDMLNCLPPHGHDGVAQAAECAVQSSNISVASLTNKAGLKRILCRYRKNQMAPLGYATVQDYCDSMDHLHALATVNKDMKDVQRSWVFKAILGSVSRGSKLLEIGAGEPHVADLLSRLGYDVTVVDPYDGSGNGPLQYQAFVRDYPYIRFIRDIFTDRVEGVEPGSFDCIYSISVLEHIPESSIAAVFEGMSRFSKATSGYSIHAIDHVLKGRGDREHLAKLHIMMDHFGISRAELDKLLRKLEDDTEAYFLSAFSHNLWRATTPYDDFPMRRCVSIQICLPIAAVSECC